MKTGTTFTKSILIAIALLAFVEARAEDAGLSDWFDVAKLKSYSAARTSSGSRFSESNFDTNQIIPGGTLVLADLKGAGMVTHIWITADAVEFGWPRLLRLRVYYDGALTPSVDTPLGDFFGVGHGVERNINSIMVHNTSFGRARNSYWPMPFRKRCRITITNEGRKLVPLFYYHVDYRRYSVLPANLGYFHAYYRQERPARAGRDYEFLNIRGRGHYVGTVLSVVQTQGAWFGEGDDLFYIDGAQKPQLVGTGTEDYFGDAWGLRDADGLLTGTPLADGEQPGARLTVYRWHVPDPIPFRKSLRAAIEHSGWTLNADGTIRSGFEERPDNFSSVAFWYQEGVNETLQEPPYGRERLPFGNAIPLNTARSIQEIAAEKGKFALRGLDDDNVQVLSFLAEGEGAQISVPIEVPNSGKFVVMAITVQAQNYGDYIALMDGKALNSDSLAGDIVSPSHESGILRGYSSEIYLAHDVFLGMLEISQGRHVLTFRCIGKHPQSSAYNLGLVDIVLEELRSTDESSRVPSTRNRTESAANEPLYRGQPLAHYTKRLSEVSGVERAKVTYAIGQFGVVGRPAFRSLVEALVDPSPLVRQATATALGQVNDPRAAESLGRALRDEDFVVRGCAAEALQHLGGTAASAIPQLGTALDDSAESVRLAAARALGAMGADAAPSVTQLAARIPKEDSGLVLIAIAEALGNIGTAARVAIPALRNVRNQPLWPPSKDEAERAIRRITGQKVATY